MFNIFEKVDDYERDRISNDKYNDKEIAIKEALKVEQEDAEALLNEIDLGFESNFDANLHIGHRKESSMHNFA